MMKKKKNAATKNSNSNSSTPTTTPPLSSSILSIDDCVSTNSMTTTTPTPTTTTRSNNNNNNNNSSSSNKPMSNNKRSKCWRYIFTASLVILVLALSLLQVLRGFSTAVAMTTTTAEGAFSPSTLVQRVEAAFLMSDLLLTPQTATTTATTTTATATATATAQSLTATPPRKSAPPTIITTKNVDVVPVVSVFQGQEPSFHQDALCVGCREQTVQTGKHAHQSCGSLIYKQLQHNNNNLVDATRIVLAQFAEAANHNNDTTTTTVDECHLCRPDACLDSDKYYWRLDTIAPRVLHAKTLYLPSIPAVHRVPNPNLVNITRYFSSNVSNVHPHRTYFFEYNPSIVQIPKSQIPHNVLTPQQQDNADDTVVYLASFRVTNTQQCVHGQDEVMMIGGKWPRPPSQDYLGLALLRHDLSIIVDVVLDNQNIRYKALHGMEDYRLFVLHEQIYVASFNKIVPLWLVPPPTTTTNSSTNNNVVLVENKFPSILTVYARTFASCTGTSGKNINYFIDSSSSSSKVVTAVAEMYPMLGKVAVNLEQPCPRLADDKKAKKQAATAQVLHHNATLPTHKSFGSYEEIHFFNHGAVGTMSGERGSACCVEIPNPTTTNNNNSSKYLLLGISHSKTKFKTKATRDNLPGNVSANHFFSAFYAMEPHEPFTVRARSGRFCLGFPNVNETATSTNDDMDKNNKDKKNPFARNNMVQLRLGGNHYDCPRIHFVSGMVEKANDPSRIIIAYGIQDCAPRFIEVEKLQVLQMLFPDMFRN